MYKAISFFPSSLLSFIISQKCCNCNIFMI
nr:MAG TPA: hypothetical protein [Caudoviricetes sp.]